MNSRRIAPKPRTPKAIVTPKGWIAEAWIDGEGNRSTASVPGALGLFAICVNSEYPPQTRARLELLRDIAHHSAVGTRQNRARLFVLPAGFFDYYAEPFDTGGIQKQLKDELRHFPPDSHVAIGVDNDTGQNIWICSLSSGILNIRMIARGKTDLPLRQFNIGPVASAFFVCGEFTGSSTDYNGPYYNGCFLDNPRAEMPDCRLVIDLAHREVPGPKVGQAETITNMRWPHHSQIRRFAPQGAAILTHHHPNATTSNLQPRFDCRSDWIFYRGGQRIYPSEVREIP